MNRATALTASAAMSPNRKAVMWRRTNPHPQADVFPGSSDHIDLTLLGVSGDAGRAIQATISGADCGLETRT